MVAASGVATPSLAFIFVWLCSQCMVKDVSWALENKACPNKI